jgi:hypothetical protein
MGFGFHTLEARSHFCCEHTPDMLELFNAQVTLAKFTGKGGWTYAPVGQLPSKPPTHFGVLKVRGQLDEVVVESAHLMPMGKGAHFLPVNAALRKKLGKQAGDAVHLQLFAAENLAALTIAMADFTECLGEVPTALRTFQQLPVAQQQAWLSWVTQAELDDQKIARIEQVIAQLGAEKPTKKSLLPPT